MRPRILVTLDLGTETRRGVPFSTVHLKAAYAQIIEAAGGTPILAAPTEDPAVLHSLSALMDGLVLTGGNFDIDPALYGRTVPAGTRVDTPKPLRTRFEWSLLESALAAGKPVLGICGGMQLLNVVLGGSLLLDIQTERSGALDHEQASSPATPDHLVHLIPGTALAALLGARIQVNSTHHQAVDRLGRGLVALGHGPDGVVEAIGHADSLSVLGVQWHPELLDDAPSRAIYGALVERAATR